LEEEERRVSKMAVMKTLLALTAIFLFHQSIHFWGASTAQPGFEIPGNLQFSNFEEVFVQKKQGNLNNIRTCKRRVDHILANVSGVLAADCLPNNGGHVRPPVGSLNFNISFDIPKQKSVGDTTDQNGGITTLVEEWGGRDPNVTVTPGEDSVGVAVFNVNANTQNKYFFQV
jgi:hypothetical protein